MIASLATTPTFHSSTSEIRCFDEVAAGVAARRGPAGTWRPAIDENRASSHNILCNPEPSRPGTCVHFLNPIDTYGRQPKVGLRNPWDNVLAYDDRIPVLAEQAYLEGYFLNSGSTETFQLFFLINPLLYFDNLTLLENGNLRAVWQADDASHVGLQFLENGFVQFVLFKQRHSDSPVSRAYGRDTPHGVIQLISALGLVEMLYP